MKGSVSCQQREWCVNYSPELEPKKSKEILPEIEVSMRIANMNWGANGFDGLHHLIAIQNLNLSR